MLASATGEDGNAAVLARQPSYSSYHEVSWLPLLLVEFVDMVTQWDNHGWIIVLTSTCHRLRQAHFDLRRDLSCLKARWIAYEADRLLDSALRAQDVAEAIAFPNKGLLRY